MRLRHVIIGVLGYLAGAAILLAAALVISGGQGLLEAVSVWDLVVLLVGALVVAMGALTLQRIEYGRPTPGSEEGGRPVEREALSREGFAWASLTVVIGAGVACAVAPADGGDDDAVHSPRGTFQSLLIDGDRDALSVSFAHQHADDATLALGLERPCGRCHHLNLPGEEATSCATCHRSMDDATDIFDHSFHAAALGDNEGCTSCHRAEDDGMERTRANVNDRVGCVECHASSGDQALNLMVATGSPYRMADGLAPSYEDAMHGLCRGCHEQQGLEEATRCPTCHPSGGVRPEGD